MAGDPKGRSKIGFEHHIFVCENVRVEGHARGSCGRSCGPEVRAALKAGILKRGLKGSVRANASGCLDFCESGPLIVVYPEGVWYRIEDIERDVDAILDRHIGDGEIVERLRLTDLSPKE